MSDWIVVFIDLEAETRSGLRIGGPSPRLDTDMPVHRDHRGQPLLPGSSLKGVLRSTAERVLRARGGPGEHGACDVLTEPCLGRLGEESEVGDDELERRCWCCRVFGGPHCAGRLTVGDLQAVAASTIVRDGVGIDRDELRAAPGVKYDYEVVVPGSTFAGTLRIDDPERGDIGLVLGLLDLFEAGVSTLGSGTSRGLGQVRISVTGIQELRASTWVPGSEPSRWDDDRIRREREDAGILLGTLAERAGRAQEAGR